MDYIGEHLLPGQIGHLLVILSFVASIIASVAYFISARSTNLIEEASWKKLGRAAFFIDAISVFGIFIILISLIYNHRYEYQYVYKNSGNDLEPKYILSSLWSASEGSFILWTLWHAVLGLVLIFTSKKWEAPVMSVLSFAQVCLATMMLGIYFFGTKVGSSPFALFREQMPDLPVFQFPDYALRIKDGNGLNMLLQNYWMVIHPPVLFLGFASTVVPFSFAMGGLMTKKYGEWVKPALPWALFSACVLGVGVMMGGAWAYESLSFGGYWAWDPVENASLVPWLVLVAGIHTLIIYKSTGRSLQTSFFLMALTFILIVYSTFLTRSGILGETSVHSFADLGMNAQLYLFLYAFFWVPAILSLTGLNKKLIVSGAAILFLLLAGFVHPLFALISPIAALVLFLVNMNKLIPAVKKEEAASSREFWMFIGSLVILFSAIIIIAQTSLPVYNKVFGKKAAPPQDIEFSYNRIQIFIAIIIGLLTAIGQYLKYKETGSQYFFRKIGLPFIVSAIASGLILAFGNINYDKYGIGYLTFVWTAIACSVFAIIANLSYIWIGINGKLKLSGPSIAHFGFGIMLLGILISSSKKEILSYNTSGIAINFGEQSKENTGENMTLPKGMKMDMGKYWVTYSGDSSHPKKSQKYFRINFTDKERKEEFTLRPNAFINYKGNEGLSANPDAKHYWNYDVFAYITALADPEKNKDTSNFISRFMNIGDTVSITNGYLALKDLKSMDSLPKDIFGADGKLYKATVHVVEAEKSGVMHVHIIEPKMAIAKGEMISIPDTARGVNDVIVQLQLPKENGAVIGIKEPKTVQDFLTLKVYKFPFINLLWLGTIIMAIGFVISMVRRIQLSRTQT
ncbi:MAG TPA: cytochrome c biogenesis protein CcsA [Chitinophagaceae bacterium]|nr:cytochrome c biogenesis protein CcsA [Chitinophagaceae bacterium]